MGFTEWITNLWRGEPSPDAQVAGKRREPPPPSASEGSVPRSGAVDDPGRQSRADKGSAGKTRRKKARGRRARKKETRQRMNREGQGKKAKPPKPRTPDRAKPTVSTAAPPASSQPPSGTVCDCCGKPVASPDGLVLTTREVMTSPRYWEAQYKLNKVEEPMLAPMLMTLASNAKGWLFCKPCAKLCRFSLVKAADAAVLGGHRADCGSMPPAEAAITAGAAWFRMTGRWPSAFQTARGIPDATEAEEIARGVYGG